MRSTDSGATPTRGALDFLLGGGEMGALMRAHDWSRSSLGPPAGWPQSLRTVVRLMLNTGHPMYIWWGPELACLYNDAYRRVDRPGAASAVARAARRARCGPRSGRSSARRSSR